MGFEKLLDEWMGVFENVSREWHQAIAPNIDYDDFLKDLMPQKKELAGRDYYIYENKVLGWAAFEERGEDATFVLFDYHESN